MDNPEQTGFTYADALAIAIPVAILGLFFLPSFTAGREHRHVTDAAADSKAYAEAQEIYRRTDYDRDGVLEYAQSIGGANSLVDIKPGDGALGLLDKRFATAEGLPGIATPKAGYVYKILKAQGPAAPGGAKSYLDKNGNMTEGYAVIAAPDDYLNSGKYSYMIDRAGQIYQRDLGPDTPRLFAEMTEFNPDSNWMLSE